LKKPTSKNAKKSLPPRIPRISTRGFYDLSTGKTLKKKPYDLYPKKFFESLGKFQEFTIMIHGLRNDKEGALAKFKIAQKRLKQLGYKYPVVGFSYDSNTKGIQYKSTEQKASNVGRIIAKKNGKNLAKFILDFKKKNPNTKIRLVGHSLGTEVIVHALVHLTNKKDIVESVYFFAGSLSQNFLQRKLVKNILQTTIRQKIFNYYDLCDAVLQKAHILKIVNKPIGCFGMPQNKIKKHVQRRLKTQNHRFLSYSLKLERYP
jgi:hypothetical protein